MSQSRTKSQARSAGQSRSVGQSSRIIGQSSRPVGRSPLWDEQGSPSIHAADGGVPAASRPIGSSDIPRATSGSAQRSADRSRPAATSSASPARTAAGERSRVSRDRRRNGGDGAGSGGPPRGRTAGPRSNRWRAIVIPALVVLTLVVIFEVNSTPDGTTSTAAAPTSSAVAPASGGPGSRTTPTTGAAAPSAAAAADPPAADPAADDPAAAGPAAPAAGVVPDPNNTDTAGHIAASIAAGALPAGPEFAINGPGTWHVVPGSTPKIGTGEQHSTYLIEVEDGLQTPEEDQAFAAEVDAVLADPRSWIGGGAVSMTRIDSGDPDFRIALTSQLTIRGNCGWEVPLEASCFNGRAGRVFINDARWVRGAMAFNGDLAAYRAYAVNHEVGHALGNGHQPCPGQGALAPVMMQQSWSTSDDDLSLLDPQRIPRDGNVCLANPFPYPEAVAAAG